MDRPLEIAYAAGIVDGEGSIYIQREMGGFFPYVVVSISSTDKELLEWMKERFGGSWRERKKQKEHHSTPYVWHVDHRAGVEFLRMIYPYLVIDRRRAKVKAAIAYGETAVPGSYSQKDRDNRMRLLEEFKSL